LIWPLALFAISFYAHIGLSYPSLADDPFAISLFAGLLMSYGAGSILKLLFYKPRPIPQIFHNRLQKIDASSFPSVHTANASVVGIIRSRW
jgi:membrane-associated phospholipid phosphatase